MQGCLPGRRPVPNRDGEEKRMPSRQKNVLFLCTGNYYRSRFAEAFFNARAPKADVPWRAASRGLAIELGVNNPGPMSAAAVARLCQLKIPVESYLRPPAQ